MRRMVARRPRVLIAIGHQDASEGSEGSENPDEEAAETPDVPDAADEGDDKDPADPDPIVCPNCGCKINPETGKALPGHEPPIGDEAKARGSLDTSDSTYTTPGSRGTAYDAAKGDDALARALGSLASLKG